MAVASAVLLLSLACVLVTCSAWSNHGYEFEEVHDQKVGDGVEWFPGQCKACKWIVRRLKKRIPEGAAEDIIREKVLSVCDKASFLKRPCRWLVKKYVDKLTEELSTHDDVRTVCVNLKACRSHD